MHIFVTDKYRVFTFALIGTLICFCAGIMRSKSVSVSSTTIRKIPVYSVMRDDNKISVTFNCAWGAGDIDDILKTLKKHKCKSTFFVLGTWAENNPEAIKKIYDAGHEIGNHGYNHTMYTSLKKDEITEDIKKCDDAVKKTIGKSTTLLRAPSGDFNNTVIEACDSAGKTYIQWSVDSLDWKGLTKDEMLERINTKTTSGSILLFHNDTKYTSQSLDAILTSLSKKGFKFSKVSDLIYKDNYIIDNTGLQIKQNPQ